MEQSWRKQLEHGFPKPSRGVGRVNFGDRRVLRVIEHDGLLWAMDNVPFLSQPAYRQLWISRQSRGHAQAGN
jgi:hypothetical protein